MTRQDKTLIFQVEMLDWFGQDISPEQDKSLRKSIVEEGNSRGTPCWTGKCISKYLMPSRFYFWDLRLSLWILDLIFFI